MESIKSKEQVYQELAPLFQSVEKERQQMLQKLKLPRIIFWISCFLWILFFYFLIDLIRPYLHFFLFACIIIQTGQYINIIFRIDEYKDQFKDVFVKPILHALNPKLKYRPDQHIPQSQFYKSGLFPDGIDKYSGEDLISGKLDKTWFKLSEIRAAIKGDKSDTIVLDGLFMVADFHKKFKGWTVVIPELHELDINMHLGSQFKSLNKETLEDVDFEKAFQVCSDDPITARYILSFKMQEGMLNLKKNFGANVAFSFLDSKVYIAISWQNNLLDPDFKLTADARETIYEFYEEIKLCFSIIEELNLNTRIWTKS